MTDIRNYFKKAQTPNKKVFFLFEISRVKADFIRAKYQQMAYINRLKDETNESLEDLNLVKEDFYINIKLIYLLT